MGAAGTGTVMMMVLVKVLVDLAEDVVDETSSVTVKTDTLVTVAVAVDTETETEGAGTEVARDDEALTLGVGTLLEAAPELAAADAG